MIDLHIHTNHSDGTSTVREILKKAESLGLTYISITDHETCGAYEELERINDHKELYKGVIIPGIELKAFYHGKIIDILGYDIDTHKMNQWLQKFYQGKGHAEIQTKYLKKYYNTCRDLGMKLTLFEDIEWHPKNDWASVIIYREIKRNGENRKYLSEEAWEKFDVFKYNYCYNKNSEFYIDKSEDHPRIDQVITAIHQAGGKAFLAHVFIYKWAKDKKVLMQELIDDYDFDGIECYYSKFTKEQIEYVISEAKKRNLYCSGGCDYHGDNKPDIKLGIGKGDFEVPDEVLKEWYLKGR